MLASCSQLCRMLLGALYIDHVNHQFCLKILALNYLLDILQPFDAQQMYSFNKCIAILYFALCCSSRTQVCNIHILSKVFLSERHIA